MEPIMEITNSELTLLNFYRASELHGGLVLGRMVQRARDPGLMLELTRHGAEEIVHAQLWTETILAVGGRPYPVRETYQTRYAEALGAPTSMLQILALTQVFERRVYRHFTEHLRRPDTHLLVAATLRRMLEEEKGHLSWVKRWLDQQREQRGLEVDATLRRYAAADAVIYARLTLELGWRRAA
jgi:demethoxyubiquinone hydroxylase (CLK1/Coq7/Cat5 family)